MALTSRLVLVTLVAFLAFHGTRAKQSSVSRDRYRLYQDAKRPVEDRIQDLLSRMTLLEKIGQMTQTERTVTNHTNIREFGLGVCACWSLSVRH